MKRHQKLTKEGGENEIDAGAEGEGEDLESGKMENAVLDAEAEVWTDERAEEKDTEAEREFARELKKEGLSASAAGK